MTADAGEVSDDEEGGPITIKHRGRTIVANSPQEAARAVEAITHLPESCKGRTIDITTAERRARKMGAAKAGRQGTPEGEEDVDFQAGDEKPPEPEEYVLDLKVTVTG